MNETPLTSLAGVETLLMRLALTHFCSSGSVEAFVRATPEYRTLLATARAGLEAIEWRYENSFVLCGNCGETYNSMDGAEGKHGIGKCGESARVMRTRSGRGS